MQKEYGYGKKEERLFYDKIGQRLGIAQLFLLFIFFMLLSRPEN
jgi:hypothetical protein